jgi:hypothetical protein
LLQLLHPLLKFSPSTIRTHFLLRACLHGVRSLESVAPAIGECLREPMTEAGFYWQTGRR